MVSKDTATAMLIFGGVILLVGFAMPAEYTKTVEKCSEDRSVGNCGDQWVYETEEEVNNQYKAPTIVGGGVLAVVGLLGASDEDHGHIDDGGQRNDDDW